MSVEGLPDPKRHAICRKCLEWCQRHEGDVIWPPITGLMSFVQVRAAKLADSERFMQFWCRACQQRQAERSAKFIRSALVSLIVLAAVASVMWWFGVFDQIVDAFHSLRIRRR